MLNPWFSFGLAAARRGLEAQSAFVASLQRIMGSSPSEPARPIDNTEQIVNALPEPPTLMPVSEGRRGKVAKSPPGNDKIIKLKTHQAHQAPKRAAAASSKRHAKTLRSRHKGR
jgi:hypothetical protein